MNRVSGASSTTPPKLSLPTTPLRVVTAIGTRLWLVFFASESENIAKRIRHWIQQLLRRKITPGIVDFLVAGICTLAFILAAAGVCASLLGRDAAGSRDFICYWASGHQLAHHDNPYDRDAILGLERSAGYPSDTPALMMRNPPPALLLTLPLGLLTPSAALRLWSLLLVACLVTSVRMVWIMHGRPKNHLNLLGYTFGPALVCLLAGQTSIFALLGLVLFLRLHRSHQFLAGVSLWLCMLKPHLFLPFGVALLVWGIVTQSYRVLAGTAVALGVGTVSVLILDPLVWMQYGRMIRSDQVGNTVIPCLSVALRQVISPDAMWLQFLPAAIGCVWALTYFHSHRDNWDWITDGSPLMLISVLVAPYAWLTDQVILIPALLQAVYLTRSRSLVAAFALTSAALQLAIFRGGSQLLHSPLYLWIVPAWLAWYVCAVRCTGASEGVRLVADEHAIIPSM